ncbi:periplasmic binding protein [Cutibacterium acnes JCM 18918]|nr:periplasmic binding protein [Cutibacterium acnes JCM 18918]
MFFALEQFAAWQHPKQFKGVDLTKDFAKFHEDYLPFGYRGVFFRHAEEVNPT